MIPSNDICTDRKQNDAGGFRPAEGVGHMSDVPVAAFDPLFWMHHWYVVDSRAIVQALTMMM